MRRARQDLLFFLALECALAAAKKRKQPAVPTELLSGCPFHREQASPDELSEFGHELERDGRNLEAERCYARAIRSSPEAAIGWFDLAAARQYSDQSAAIRYYRHGLKLRPSGFQYNQYGVIMRQTERHVEAVQHFRTAARLQPADADALFNLGGSHELLEQPAEALHAYRGALEREAKNEARIHNNIGTVLSKVDRWPEAIKAFREAEEADPDFPETHFNLAHVLLAAERLEEAEGHLRTAERLQFDPAKSAAKRDELHEALAKRAARRRRQDRVAEQEKRDGHLSKAQRLERMQQVIGHCGVHNKQCMREMLGQADGATDEDAVRF